MRKFYQPMIVKRCFIHRFLSDYQTLRQQNHILQIGLQAQTLNKLRMYTQIFDV